jgi:hypothetical protein
MYVTELISPPQLLFNFDPEFTTTMLCLVYAEDRFIST